MIVLNVTLRKNDQTDYLSIAKTYYCSANAKASAKGNDTIFVENPSKLSHYILASEQGKTLNTFRVCFCICV